jgi:hypothetical protein
MKLLELSGKSDGAVGGKSFSFSTENPLEATR